MLVPAFHDEPSDKRDKLTLGQLTLLFIINYRLLFILPRDAMHKRGLYAVMQCLCVCPSVTFVHSVKTNKDIFEVFLITG